MNNKSLLILLPLIILTGILAQAYRIVEAKQEAADSSASYSHLMQPDQIGMLDLVAQAYLTTCDSSCEQKLDQLRGEDARLFAYLGAALQQVAFPDHLKHPYFTLNNERRVKVVEEVKNTLLDNPSIPEETVPDSLSEIESQLYKELLYAAQSVLLGEGSGYLDETQLLVLEAQLDISSKEDRSMFDIPWEEIELLIREN